MLYLKLSLFLSLILFLSVFIYSPVLAQCTTPSDPSKVTIKQNDGLATAFNIGGNFNNVSKNCVGGAEAVIPLNQTKIKVDTYDDLFSLFYTQNRTTQKTVGSLPQSGASYSITGQNLFYIPRDLRINRDIVNSTTNTVVLVFVEGNLYIDNDINFADSDLSSGLVFVTKGAIMINPAVTKVNAALIAEGIICTGYDSLSQLCPNRSQNFNNRALTVNGSLISLAKGEGDRIRFTRALNDNTQAAERINAQPKYLVILKDIFSKTVSIQSEDEVIDITQ